MKRIYTFTLITLFPAILLAQISIDNSDMPSSGDTIRTSISSDIGLLDFISSGPGYNWDFSSLVPLNQQVDTFVSVQETPWVYQAVFFLSSNLAQPIQNAESIPGFEVSDAYNYYKNSSSSFKMTGNAITMNSIPIPNKFDEYDYIFRFPLDFGNVDSSMSSYGMDVPGLGYMGGWKKRVNTCDGWGTLSTPYGSFQTLRVASHIIQHDSMYIDSLGFGFPIHHDYMEYKWLGNGFGIPLCTFSEIALVPTVTYIDSVRSSFVGIQSKVVTETPVTVFPNPTNNGAFAIELEINEPSYTKVTLRNSKGEEITTLLNNNMLTVNTTRRFNLTDQNLSKGLYFVIVEMDDRVFVEKIVFQ